MGTSEPPIIDHVNLVVSDTDGNDVGLMSPKDVTKRYTPDA